jgi:hypothetical protein
MVKRNSDTSPHKDLDSDRDITLAYSIVQVATYCDVSQRRD